MGVSPKPRDLATDVVRVTPSASELEDKSVAFVAGGKGTFLGEDNSRFAAFRPGSGTFSDLATSGLIPFVASMGKVA